MLMNKWLILILQIEHEHLRAIDRVLHYSGSKILVISYSLGHSSFLVSFICGTFPEKKFPLHKFITAR